MAGQELGARESERWYGAGESERWYAHAMPALLERTLDRRWACKDGCTGCGREETRSHTVSEVIM